MKKRRWRTLLCVAMMLFLLISNVAYAKSNPTPNDLIGIWKFDSALVNGEKFTKEQFLALNSGNFEFEFTFKKGGKWLYSYTIPNQTQEGTGTWTIRGRNVRLKSGLDSVDCPYDSTTNELYFSIPSKDNNTVEIVLTKEPGSGEEDKPQKTTSSSGTYKKKFLTGTYVVGKDIEEGACIIKCVDTDADDRAAELNQLGSMMSMLGVGNGNMVSGMSALIDDEMTITIKDKYGDTLRSFTIENGESVAITLTKGTTIVLSNGDIEIQKQP